MIDIKYKKIYDEFIKKYEEIHVNPWHEISKKQLKNVYVELTNKMNVDDEYSFKYFIDYIIKRLSGSTDAHTKYKQVKLIPINFRKFEDEIIVNYPESLKGFNLVSISGIPISKIIEELEDVITYGTDGKRDYEIEQSLFNRFIMFGLPSFRNSNEMVYEISDSDGNIVKKRITKEAKYDDLFDYDNYLFGNNAKYEIIDNCLVYYHSSVQKMFEDIIKNSIKKLETENLSEVDTIIIDLRGNFGGNSNLNLVLTDFLKKHLDKKLICLTDYRVFSAGRYALKDLIDLGAITIGGEISTPINCYGNNANLTIQNHNFKISERYFNPCKDFVIRSKKDYKKTFGTKEEESIIFKPDIKVQETKENFINGIDTVLNYALEYSKRQRLRK